VAADEVEISRSPRLAADGSFAAFVDTEPVGGTETAWRSEDTFAPGTYYVHVSGNDIGCTSCPATEWSNVLQVVIPVPVSRTGRYQGRTDPAGLAISFILSADRRTIRLLKFAYELNCFRGGFPSAELRGSVIYRSPIPVHRRGGFARVIHYPLRFRGGPRGSATVTFRGQLRPPSRATGSLRARATLSGGERCRDTFGTETWSATRR
jgi:hypothetical protein